MAGNLLKYAGPLQWDDLPIGSHELIALSAPRPLFIGGGATNGDGWADSEGMFMAAAAANLSIVCLVNVASTQLFSAYRNPAHRRRFNLRQHAGGHTQAPNWPTFITFHSRYLKYRK